MKQTTSFLTIFVILALVMGLTLIASQNRADLETRVEGLLLLAHGFEISAIEALAPRPAIRDVLLRMVTKYRNADPDTNKSLDILLLDGAVFTLGELKEEQALQPLSDLLADRTVDSGARGRAAQALGKIDADASKEVLLRSLAPDNPDEFTVRMDAIDALGKSRNEAVIASLQRCVETEKEESLKQRLLGAISEIRSRIQ